MFDFTSLTKAIASLSAALDAAKVRPEDEFVRDASIQRFEYTDELCVKFFAPPTGSHVGFAVRY